MRELERDPTDNPPCTRLAVVGQGRLGPALATALRRSGFNVDGPLGRGADGSGADAVLLCVPDGEIAAAAAAVRPGPLVGHCSGATSLDALAPHRRFSLHPLMTVTGGEVDFRGAGAAIAGDSEESTGFARRLATRLGMAPIELDEADRALYHAAASMASNFLVTLEGAAEQLAGIAGLERAMLVPLVRATLENWAALGPEHALTGPIARGDEVTVARQREAIADHAPELLEMFDVLAAATRRIAGRVGQAA